MDVVFGRSLAVDVGIILPGPVDEGVVETQFEALLPYLLAEWGEHVLLGRGGLHGTEIASLGVPQREAIVVFRGDDRILCATLLDEFCPIGRVIVRCGEFLRLVHVFLKGDRLVVECPAFRCPSCGIDSPVDEDTEFGS